MRILDETRFIERLQFFNGQRLFASDLQGIEAFNREMRWLHNKSLHQPGIGNGFAVSGEKGAREVTIGPGYAINAMGQEIVLTRNWTEPVPPVSGEDDGSSVFYDLTVSYPADADLEEAETRAGICLPRGVIRLREEPVFCWVRLERDEQGNLHAKDLKLQSDVKNGLKIVLARAEVLNCQLNQPVSIAQRRNARPAKQPFIACGIYDPNPWKSLQLSARTVVPTSARAELPVFILPLGLSADIDTSSAGFLTTPCYNARIAGPRIKSQEIQETGSPTTFSFIIDGLVNIRDLRPQGFTVDVLLLVQLLTEGSIEAMAPMLSILATAEPSAVEVPKDFLKLFSDWTVVWMGVEG